MSDTFWSNYGAGSNSVNNVANQIYQRRAATSLAGGDYTSAMQNIARTGDMGAVVGLQDRQAQQQQAERTNQEQAAARSAAFARQAAGALKAAVANGQDPLTAFDAMSPAMSQMGVTPEQQQEFRAALQANPAGLIQGIEAWADGEERKLSFQKAGDSVLVFQEGNPDPVRTYEAPRQPIKVGDVLVDPVTYEPILDAREPRYQTVTNSDGTTSVVAIDQPAPIRGGSSTGGNIDAILDGIIRREGGYVARDGRSGAPANFGINQRANPDVDVANLTEDQARQIYRDRYITPIVEAGVSGPALEAVIDFGVNAGVQRSLGLWRQSGGDIDEFNRLRLQHYRSLPDYDQNGRSWERRVAETTPGQRGADVPVSGGTRVVARGQNTGPAVRTLSAQEKRDLGLPETGVYQRRQDGTISQVAGSESGGANRKGEADLRKEFNARQEVKDFRQIQAAYNNVRAAAANPSAAGDLSMIFAYMKILDPGSVVREQEFANAQNAAGVPDQIRNRYNQVLRGERLNPTQRADFLRQAEALYGQRRNVYDGVASEYRSYAADYGLDPSRVVGGTAEAPRLPRVRFPLTRQQQQWGAVEGRYDANQPLGARTNPHYINEAASEQSYNNIPAGHYFVAPEGRLLRKRGSR